MPPHLYLGVAVVLMASLLATKPASPGPLHPRRAPLVRPTDGAQYPVPRRSVAHGGESWRSPCTSCRSPHGALTAAPKTPTLWRWKVDRPIRNTGDLPVRAIPAARLLGEIFGMGTYFAQRGEVETSTMVRRTRLSGATWVREEFTATAIHSGPRSRYRWAPYDRVVGAERRAGLQILGLLDYSNTWGYGDHGAMPHQDLKRMAMDYASYAYAAARHYRGRIQYWELWNEPNLAIYWHPAPSPSDYAVLVDVASRAIKQANPRARVVLAGTSGVDLDFIRAVATHTTRFDVVSVHPYRSQPETELLAQVRALQSIGKPVWFSEIGWPAGQTCSDCLDEEEQAHYLVRFYALAAAAGVQRVFWYDFRDDARGVTQQETHFGLVRRDLSAKPAFVAYANMAHMLKGTRFVGADRLGADGVYVLRFRYRDRPVAILWNVGKAGQTVRIPWTTPEADVVATDGKVLKRIRVKDGTVTRELPADGDPVYILDRDPAYLLPLAATRAILPTFAAAAVHVVPTPQHPRRQGRHAARRHISSATATALIRATHPRKPPRPRGPSPERTVVLSTPRTTVPVQTASPLPTPSTRPSEPSPTPAMTVHETTIPPTPITPPELPFPSAVPSPQESTSRE